jgi:hypothetical protein
MLEIRFAHAVVRYAARNDGDDEPNARSIEPEGRRTPPLCFKKKRTPPLFGSTLIRSTHMNALKFILIPTCQPMWIGMDCSAAKQSLNFCYR